MSFASSFSKMTTTTWSGLGSPAASPVCSARGCSGAPDEDGEDEASGCVAPEEHAASRVRTVASTTTPTRLLLIGPVSPNLRAGAPHPPRAVPPPPPPRQRGTPTAPPETERGPGGRRGGLYPGRISTS